MSVLTPNARSDWLDTDSQDDWSSFIRIADQQTKESTERRNERSIFKLFSLGLATNRDDWAYARSSEELRHKVEFFAEQFNEARDAIRQKKPIPTPEKIKWSSELKASLRRSTPMTFDKHLIQTGSYRPFVKQNYYHDERLVHRFYQANRLVDLPPRADDKVITFLCVASNKPLSTLASGSMFDLCYTKVGNGGSFGVSRYRYTRSGERIDNITDWAANKFRAHYGKAFPGEGRGPGAKRTNAAGAPSWAPAHAGELTAKDAIFAYCYAVLHDPLYREKYALNLKREFPRIPFYDDFAKWAGWGQQLLDLHIGYEQAKPFKLTRIDTPNPKRAKGSHPKPKLKSDPDKGLVIVDEDTQLTGIPSEAWTYRLGNRSAIDWVLDQHKEKTPRDPTVREKFNTYRLADYKESMIDLLAKVVTVSLETVKITEAMRAIKRESENEQ